MGKAVAKKEATPKDKKGDAAKPAEPSKLAKSSAKVPAKGQESESFNLVGFLASTKEELGKVVWPNRQQIISESAAVILMVSLSATVIYLVDNLLSWASKLVFR